MLFFLSRRDEYDYIKRLTFMPEIQKKTVKNCIKNYNDK